MSDGLLQDLGHILSASGDLGAELVLADLPVNDELAALEAEDRWALQLSGGDDYGLLFTWPAGVAVPAGGPGHRPDHRWPGGTIALSRWARERRGTRWLASLLAVWISRWISPIRSIGLLSVSARGCRPVAPGTAGSALALLLWWWLARLPMPWYLLLVLALSLAGVWICGSTSGQLGLHDPSAVVWDEWVGLWLALAGLPRRWWWGTAGFVVFRLFDVIKAGPVGWADHAMPRRLGYCRG